MYDLMVIGAGPGGYVAAIRAAQLGMKTLVVEKDAPGGTCLNVGCIPTKTLYKDAQVIDYFENAQEYGIKSKGFNFELELAQVRKQQVVDTLVGGVSHLFKANGIDYLKGAATIKSANMLEVFLPDGTKSQQEGKRILIASGSKSAVPPVPGIDSEGVINSTQALALTSLPKHMVVIGGGVIGIEFAGIYKAFGSQVTVVEFMPSILPTMDKELAKRLKMGLGKRGVRILTDTKVEKIEKIAKGLKLSVAGKDKEEIECDCVLVATGRSAYTDSLGLDKIGIMCERSGIKVDENYETNVKGIYAIGDVTGRVMLAHVASAEGTAAVEKMCGKNAEVNYDQIPSAVFTFPEIASIGFSEEQLKEKALGFKVGKAIFSGNGKALSMNQTEGMVKVIASEDLSQVYGVHIIGPNASDLITEAAAAMQGMFTVEEIGQIMHGHPTLSEVFMEAVNSLLGTAIHAAPAKKK